MSEFDLKGLRADEIFNHCRELAVRKRQDLKDALPAHAFAYDDGDRYVRKGYMIDIEGNVARYQIRCLEEGGRMLGRGREV